MIRTASRLAGYFVLILVTIHLASAPAFAEETPPEASSEAAPESPPPNEIIPTDYLVLPAVGQYGRLPLHRDALESQLATGTWKAPAAGDTVAIAGGKGEAWTAAKAADDGALDTQKVRGGYALATFDSPTERVMILEASGHAMVYVNGEPRAGDPYSLGWLSVPVLVRQGENNLLFHLAGDKLKVRLLAAPEKGIFVDDSDRTFPTIVDGDNEPDSYWAAVPVINATTDWLDGAKMECRLGDGGVRSTPIAPIAPLSVRKVPLQLPSSGDDGSPEPRFKIQLVGSSDALAEFEVVAKRAGPQDVHVRTFLSSIDGSVQSYAFRPATKKATTADDTPDATDAKPGLIVTLHDAGTSAEDHIAQCAAKSWAHILAPQGRRTYGFDWESWGRDDVLEAMEEADSSYDFDPRRVYLTGYSMGGHGAWHIGVTRPDLFAAIGPTAGWISYWSYGGGMPSMETASDIDALLLRGYSASDTLKLLSNLSGTGVYVLHGAADQTVPVAQARFIRSRLAAFHPNFVYFEEPGADHWWGNQSCDFPRMMEFFEHQSIPPAAEQTFIDFTTADPAISNRCHWVSIEAQQEQLSPSHVAIRQNAEARAFVANTSNVARLAIDPSHLAPGQPIDVTLDGQALSWLNWPEESGKLWFEREGDEWKVADEPSPQVKHPERSGKLSAAFNNDAILVYGTGGTEEENAWAAAKAHYDAETFYYRGNGSLEVMPDNRFEFNENIDRNVILYGNADTNTAWPKLLATSPVEVRRGQARVGSRTVAGDDLAVLTVRPRPGSDKALVGIVAGTGPVGMRLTNRLRWFVSGIVYPDIMILDPKFLTDGTAGVRAWGYFGLDWGPETGEIAWRDAPL